VILHGNGRQVPFAPRPLLEASRLARARGDAEAPARAVLANQRGFVSLVGAIDRERVDALESAVAAVGAEASPVRARLLALLANELHFSGDERPFQLCQEALATARGAGPMMYPNLYPRRG
jgi:hypothetical protein